MHICYTVTLMQKNTHTLTHTYIQQSVVKKPDTKWPETEKKAGQN